MNFNFKKKNDDRLQVVASGTEDNGEPHVLYDEPRICLFDLEEAVLRHLQGKGYNCTEASLGTQTSLSYSNRGREHKLSLLNYLIPENLHEFNIVVIDLKNDKITPYRDDEVDKAIEKNPGKDLMVFYSEFPETIFDPRSASAIRISSVISELLDKDFILIVFSDCKRDVNYQLAKISPDGLRVQAEDTISNYAFMPNAPVQSNKRGTIITVCQEGPRFSPILNKYKSLFTYDVIFYHPTIWNSSQHRSIEDQSFIPLMTNRDGEIVSFAQLQEKSVTLVFPQVSDKASFLEELFKNVLPEIFPIVFPHNSKFAWLDDPEYCLPNQISLLKQKEEMILDHREKLKKLDLMISKNNDQFCFLHSLITESGDELVKAVEIFLNWLGFDNVINIDETEPDLKEEDLRADINDGLLVIEVKGIGGTSTDNECSQISKIRFRRIEQRKKFDVKGLYIVNHQRYIPPVERQNPPFLEIQIMDAENDKRGLLTTYELYKLYNLIDQGIVNKEDARNAMTECGLVTFKPKAVSLGIPKEYFRNGQIVIIELNNNAICKGKTLFIHKNGVYSKCSIESIQVNDQEVENVCNGEVGVCINMAVPRNSELFLPID